jgi:hypothetical protein
VGSQDIRRRQRPRHLGHLRHWQRRLMLPYGRAYYRPRPSHYNGQPAGGSRRVGVGLSWGGWKGLSALEWVCIISGDATNSVGSFVLIHRLPCVSAIMCWPGRVLRDRPPPAAGQCEMPPVGQTCCDSDAPVCSWSRTLHGTKRVAGAAQPFHPRYRS